VLVMACQNWDKHIGHRQAGKAALYKGGGVDFASHRPPPPTRTPGMAPVGTVAGYTAPMPMDLSTGRGRISRDERSNSFVDGRYYHCSWCTDWVAECLARKKAETLKAAGAEVDEVRTKEGTEESGKD
jgi:hypothetical protein